MSMYGSQSRARSVFDTVQRSMAPPRAAGAVDNLVFPVPYLYHIPPQPLNTFPGRKRRRWTADRNSGWETHRVRLNRVPGYGFGIAVSGGRDNPHFASGDPSIAVSDVIRGGPAEDKLQVNDRILSVNGIPLENVEYACAVQVLRDSGAVVSLVVRRRAPAPPPTAPTTIKVTLARNGKKEDFGIVLGCKLYVKELTMRAREQLNPTGQGLCEGDVVARINNTPINDNITMKEAKKLIESCKDRLNLVVTRELIREETVTNGNYQNNYNSLEGSANVYASGGQNLYVAAPVRGGALDVRRPVPPLEHDQPPRPPPPPHHDDYFSRRQMFEEDGIAIQRSKPTSEPRLISFQKEGSVGLRLCGGNRSGVFVSGVQPTSPAALQGLQPADKLIKVNDMEMKGVAREEAVLFLLSLQERINLIVQHSPDEYNEVSSGAVPGDSFHIKTHFHYTEPTDGEMSFRCGDVFHVVDTLHNGTVGAWQVYRIGRNNQEVQKGTIPNKARAEELATAQFNATKKELSGTDGKHNFFRRRRSTHRRSKSLGKEHWDEVVLSDSISKFPAYERVVLKRPGFIRPVILLGAVADIARERLLKDSSNHFASPRMDTTLEDSSKTKSASIIRLSSIRTIMERGKHALLDITPNAVDRLNYAQFYPIVIFLKADNKHIIKQLRAGLLKSAHKSSKKLLEQCQNMERVWGHVLTHIITLSEANQNTWFGKLTDLIQRTQQQELWVSETERPEPLSDDFLFSMSSSTENRLSYASSPESDLEVSPPPAPRLVKSSSDPSIATTQDNMDRDDDLNRMGDVVPPPYTQGGYGDCKYGFSSNTNGTAAGHGAASSEAPSYHSNPIAHSPPQSPLYVTSEKKIPELPPRGGVNRPAGGVLLPVPPPNRPAFSLRHNLPTYRQPSAQERLFGPPKEGGSDEAYSARPTSMILPNTQGQSSMDRHRHANNPQSSYDGSSYEYNNAAYNAAHARLPPNAPDDLKVSPPSIKIETPANSQLASAPVPQSPQRNSNSLEHSSLDYRNSENSYKSSDAYRCPQQGRPPPLNGNSPHGPLHARGPSLPTVPTNDHKYSARTNSASQADYSSRGGAVPPYKPVPPPKPKHYRPPDNVHHPRNGSMEPGPASGSQRPPAPPYPHYSHQHSLSQPHRPPPHHNYPQQNMYGGQMAAQSPPYSGPPTHHRAINLPHNSHLIDLAGSREQRGSAFELYRKPQHMHNLSSSDAMNSSLEPDDTLSPKTKKKLSKKPSFIKNAVLDLFRSKTKNPLKVSRQKSLCENDLQRVASGGGGEGGGGDGGGGGRLLRLEKSDLGDMSVHMRNTHIRNQMLQRSNSSSCEKPVLKPILKRQSSFCDDRSRLVCTVRDYDAKPVLRSLRRQSSMCEIETEPKATPLLRRQNSLIEYNRRGIYGQVPSFNLITKIDPIYRRQQLIKHETFHPAQPLPSEPVYQSKGHIIYDPIPKPRRTYASLYDTSSENPYASRCEVLNQSFENPYGNRQIMSMPVVEPSYATRAECVRESTYASKAECVSKSPYVSRAECVKETPFASRDKFPRKNPYTTISELMAESPYATKQDMTEHSESLYSELPYSTKEHMLRQRMTPESPYATKEEMLRQRFSESPYTTKEVMLKQRMDGVFSKEPIYGKRAYDPPPHAAWSESSFSLRPERRLQTPVNFTGGFSPMSKCMSEPPYVTRTEMLERIGQTDSPYSPRAEVKSSCSDTNYSSRTETLELRTDAPRSASAECTYVSKQEILSQKAALQASRESGAASKLEEKLEIIKQRNQAKKEMIYQTRKEVNESDSMKIREPLSVSKREWKESVIYESHQENKESVTVTIVKESARSSPYELSDANHLSRREPIYATKTEIDNAPKPDTFQEIDFSKLRLTESQTDAEKEKSLNQETNVLIGEPLYAPRLHGKADHISNALKMTTSPIPYESTTSMETQYASECSMNFKNKPQSTPYTSQDLVERPEKPNRTVTFCEKILERSPEISQENSEIVSISQNVTTVISDQSTVVQASGSEANESVGEEVEPEGPYTTWGIFDSEGGVLEDRQWGVSLIIPPKAIAPGIKQKIYFTVSDPRLSQRVGGPPIDIDNGEAMLSPLVMCGPQGLVFLRPVTLRLPHCANAVPSLGLTIKATDTEAHLSTDWDQIHLPATTTLNTVAVRVDHF